MIFLSYPVTGINLTILPENPLVGDEITMKGTGTPNELLYPSVTFEKVVSVANGKYDYRLYSIKIPPGANNFGVTAKNVKNLNVRVKMLLWWTISRDAANGVAVVSQGNVPSGTYDIIIDGDPADGASSVPLTITASSKINADALGNFEYKYSSSGVPPGSFTLSIGGIMRTMTLSEKPVSTASSNANHDSSVSPIDTPIPAITPTITPTMTSVIISENRTPLPSITSNITPIPAATDAIPQPAQIPGFEIVFGIIALMVLRYRQAFY